MLAGRRLRLPGPSLQAAARGEGSGGFRGHREGVASGLPEGSEGFRGGSEGAPSRFRGGVDE
eukprot:14384047-Alexandrium_andersonii.AAC.1